MAYELPAISTARGALGEVVENERTALVVEPKGDEFAKAMIRMMEDTALCEKLGRAGRQEVRLRFSAERMVANTIAVCEEVLRARRTV
jgi:glycosyltransferase involved in cell wall biosynthesis